MIIPISETKQVRCTVHFKKPLFYNDIAALLDKAVSEYNAISSQNRRKLPFFKRLFADHDIYHVYRDRFDYVSYDGKAPMKLLVGYMLDPEEYPNAKYEQRYIINLIGIRSYMLYFNVIPGIATEEQFATEIGQNEKVSCITIKANMKSKMKWKLQQAKFLETLSPIIERLYKGMKN